MKKFHTGDRVRLVHAQGQGIVTGRNAQGLLIVMLDDGFEVPALDKDLALVHAEEQTSFATKAAKPAGPAPPKGTMAQAAAAPVPEAVATKGLFFALSAELAGTGSRDLYLVNNTGLVWTGVVAHQLARAYATLKVFNLQPRQALPIRTYSAQELAALPVVSIWGLAAIEGGKDAPTALHTAWHLPPNLKDITVERGPVLPMPVILQQLDGKPATAPDASMQALLSTWAEQGPTAPAKQASASAPSTTGLPKAATMPAEQTVKTPAPLPKAINAGAPLVPATGEVDLHIEKLSQEAASLSAPDILKIQLDYFERTLDEALVRKLPQVVFIHGVGNGTLRQEIQRRLSKRMDIGFFQDWHKDKFGYGATLVSL